MILRQFERSTNLLVIAIQVAPDGFKSVQNAPKSLAAGAPPQTPLGELTALPQTP